MRKKILVEKVCNVSQTMGLDMAGRSPEAGGAFVEMTVDVDMAKSPTLEAGLVVVEVVTSEGCIMVAAGPPDFSASDSDSFSFGQEQQ